MHHRALSPVLAFILSLTILLPACTTIRAEEAWSGEDVSVSEETSAAETSSTEEAQPASENEDDTSPSLPEGSQASDNSEVPQETDHSETSDAPEVPVLIPEAPALGTAANQKSGIKLTWQQAENAVSYQVLRKDAGADTWTILGETASLSYTDMTIESGMDCAYSVCGLAADGSVGPYDPDGLKISRVAEPVVSTSICETGTLVAWDPVPGAARYYVYRKMGTESWTRIATVKKGTSWIDTNVKNGDRWLYTVKARRYANDTYYNSSHSAGISSLFLSAPENAKGSRVDFTSLKILWAKNATAAGYEVQYATDDAFTKNLKSLRIDDPDQVEVQISDLTKGSLYYIRVRSLGTFKDKEISSWWSPVFSVDTLLKPSVTGLCHTFTRKASKTIRDTITIKNADKGTLKLQYYNASKKKWVTKETYALTGAKSQKITMQYPGDWKKKITTKWRVYIPKTSNARSYKSSTIQINAQNIKTLKLSSPSAVIVRGSDGAVLYNKNAYQAREMASTTKMMTALLTLENVKLKAKVTYTKEADETGWGCLYPDVGMKFYCKDLLHALLIESSNDSATALAQHISGSVSKFAKKMTKRAAELGCKDTNYNNPHGLHGKTHHSTAYDLCLIQRECYKHETYRSIILKKKYTFSDVSKQYTHTAYTSDDLLEKNIAGFKGGKTGWIEEAGNCFSGIYEYKGETYFFTVLGSDWSAQRWKDCESLMAYIRKYR
ncbi:MAG: fibronectin type III domain-containing protein [Clostridiales bacterium]|nr:fibronectin type III domain-containing protein [Clostridiales bacterium]